MLQEIPFGSALYEASKAFRDEILRRPLGLSLSAQDVEGEELQVHIAALEAGAIVGTVVLKPLSADVMKLRQMAVAPDRSKRGLGRQLVRFAEALARARGAKTIEMSARRSAQGFYERLGYRTEGDEFIEVTVPTIKMVRSLLD